MQGDGAELELDCIQTLRNACNGKKNRRKLCKFEESDGMGMKGETERWRKNSKFNPVLMQNDRKKLQIGY